MTIPASLKADLLRVETYIRTIAVAAAAGAVADIGTLLHGGAGMLFQPGGVHTLVQVGVGGAVIGVLGLFTRSPLTATRP